VKYWEIVADNLSKAGWDMGLRLISESVPTQNLNTFSQIMVSFLLAREQ